MSEKLHELHDRYFGRFTRTASQGGQGVSPEVTFTPPTDDEIPDYLEEVLHPETSNYKVPNAEDRRALQHYAREYGWDELNLSQVSQSRDNLEVMLQHAQHGAAGNREYAMQPGHLIAELLKQMVPINSEATFLQKRALRARRQRIAEMLNMNDDLFDLTLENWKKYEQMKMADERTAIEMYAMEEDKKDRLVGPEMRKARSDMRKLDSQNRGLLSQAAALPHVEVELPSRKDGGAPEKIADVDPVSAFRRHWQEFQASPDYATSLTKFAERGSNEAALYATVAHRFFENRLAPTLAQRYGNGNRNARNQDALMQRDLDVFIRVVTNTQTMGDFITYANRERKYTKLREARDAAMDELLYGSKVITSEQLSEWVKRVHDLDMKVKSDGELDAEQFKEFHDLQLLIEDATNGRSSFNPDNRPGQRNPGVREAYRRAISRHRQASRTGRGHTRGMRTALHTAAAIRSSGDLLWEGGRWTVQRTRRLGRVAARRWRDHRKQRAFKSSRPTPRPLPKEPSSPS